MSRIDGKVAVVTGGTQGLGAAIALRLAQDGASGIVTCGRNREKGEAVARNVEAKTSCRVRFIEADLGKVADCRAVIAAADETFGRVDVLVRTPPGSPIGATF